MKVETLPIERSWVLSSGDDFELTFSMTEDGVVIPLAGAVPFAQIREEDNNTSALVSEGICSIVSNAIVVNFPRDDFALYENSTLYGDLRLSTSADKVITLLSFSLLIKPTISRRV
jgi:hypothetical protein